MPRIRATWHIRWSCRSRRVRACRGRHRQHERHELRLSPRTRPDAELSLRVVSQPDAQSGSAEQPGGATGAGERTSSDADHVPHPWPAERARVDAAVAGDAQERAAQPPAADAEPGRRPACWRRPRRHGGSQRSGTSGGGCPGHSQAGARQAAQLWGPPHMPSSMAASFGLSAEDLNSHAGLASPMGLGQAVGGSMPVPRGRSPMGAHAGRPGQPGNAAQQQYFGQWKQ